MAAPRQLHTAYAAARAASLLLSSREQWVLLGYLVPGRSCLMQVHATRQPLGSVCLHRVHEKRYLDKKEIIPIFPMVAYGSTFAYARLVGL